MTDKEIIRMAREAGFEFNSLGGTYTSGKLDEHLKRFAALVAAAEREACAKVCEEDAFVEQWKGLAEAVRRIRARGAT
jgi:hypothetical protein